MFKPSFALAAISALVAMPTFAQTSTEAAAAAAPQSPWAFTANIGLLSDYRFRGISQTDKKPALQGGFDVAHSSGLYAGNWNSNVDSKLYNGANLEMDFYGGYKHAFDGGFGLDVGVIYYYYPNSGSSPSGSTRIDNTELYLGASYGPVSLKYNYAVSDFFGTPDSSGSSYLDAGFSYDLGHNFGFVAHYGYQWLKGGAVVTQIDGSTANNISDWKLGVTYTIDGWVIGLAYVATNRDLTGGTAALTNRNISGNTAVASVTKTF